MEGRSSFFSPFLLPSLLPGRMSLKVIVVLCLVLVGLLEANPVGMEGAKEHESSVIGDPMPEDTTGSGEEVNDMNQGGLGGHRKKREEDDNCGCGNEFRFNCCGFN